MQSTCILVLLVLGSVYAGMESELADLLINAANEEIQENEAETELARNIRAAKPDTDDAFRWVQKFLVSSKIARDMSRPGRVLEKVAKAFLERYPNLSPSEAFALLKNFRPLKAIAELAKADATSEDAAFLDNKVCPYQPISCEGQKDATFRTLDGSCNNLVHPFFGKAFTPFVRFATPDYADGVSEPRVAASGDDLPSPRLVSSKFDITKKEMRDNVATYMVMTWGQFVDHDVDLTAITKLKLKGSDATVDVKCGDGCDGTVPACFPIPIPADDPVFSGKKCLTFVRSQSVPNQDCTLGPREHLNQITSFIDASTVYGSTKDQSDALRDLKDSSRGKLKTTVHPIDPSLKHLLPQVKHSQCKGQTDVVKCFVAGDPRASEATHLITAHTIMVREHNRVEEALHQTNPQWSGERLFQEARKIVGATVQRVTYNEYLPAIFAPSSMKEFGLNLKDDGFFSGYDDSVDASISNVFATAAYRFGHSMIPSLIKRPNVDYSDNDKADLKLSQTLFTPSSIYDVKNGGMDAFVRGLAGQRAAPCDRFFADEVSSHLFAKNAPTGLGTDLASLNIQRGRDHGLPGYNAWRESCNLPVVESFEDLADLLQNPDDAKILGSIYNSVDDIDLFPAGLAEKTVSGGGVLGETFACILGKQFSRLRVGDRYWHENAGAEGFTAEQLQELRKMTLAKVFCENSDTVPKIQENMMEVVSDSNPLVDCSALPDIDFSKWQE